jgi:hypothetical protein
MRMGYGDGERYAQPNHHPYGSASKLWEKTKNFIITTVSPLRPFRSLELGLPDSALLDEFLTMVAEQLVFHRPAREDHTLCMEALDRYKMKLEEESRKVAELLGNLCERKGREEWDNARDEFGSGQLCS